MKSVLTIDPSGTGTTGIYFNNGINEEFESFNSKDWKEHFSFVFQYVEIRKPNFIVYEHTNFVRISGKDMTSLFKFFGALETLSFFFDFVEKVEIIPVNSVKEFYKKIYSKYEEVPDLVYKKGRGMGWIYKEKKISIHQLDAYLLWFLRKRNLSKLEINK